MKKRNTMKGRRKQRVYDKLRESGHCAVEEHCSNSELIILYNLALEQIEGDDKQRIHNNLHKIMRDEKLA